MIEMQRGGLARAPRSFHKACIRGERPICHETALILFKHWERHGPVYRPSFVQRRSPGLVKG